MIVLCDLDAEQVGPEAEQGADGEADDVEVITLDALDENAAAALDRVTAGAPLPLLAREVPVDDRVVEAAEHDVGDGLVGARRAVLVDESDAADHPVGA